MEQLSKFNHDSLHKTTITPPPNTYPAKQLYTTLLTLVIFFYSIPPLNTLFHPITVPLIFLVLLTPYFFSNPKPVYLVDFSCLKPPIYWRVPFASFLEHSRLVHGLDDESVAFMSKILNSSGQSQRTCIPPSLHYIPPRSTNEEAVNEFQLVVFPVLEDLFSKTKLSPTDIDILIVNCSGFCPSPSLSSIIVNEYSMRDDVKSFNISGMGCSASALAVDMAKNLLKVHENCNAVIVSTEILSNGWYAGKDRSMMVLNCLFRTGAAAILLTNKTEAKPYSKYKLILSLRTQRATDDKSYRSAMREEDSEGKIGFTLRKELLRVAGETLRSNILVLGSVILPVTEKLRYVLSITRKRFSVHKVTEDIYVPDFRGVIQHFCLPASGKAVIGEIGKGLKLGEGEMEPALMTLHRFGNQSSSSLWYELAYMEAKERVKEGQRVWQLGMGSGPKCTSLVWECNRAIFGEAQVGPWGDCIDEYPVNV